LRFLLDTNAVVSVLRLNTIFLDRLRMYQPSDLGIPTPVWHELCFGAYRSRRVEHHLADLQALRIQTVEFDSEDARCAGEIRAALAAAGSPIGPYDVLVAAQAVARDLTLITHNVREFARVDGLKIEDWETTT
jgi:tRNA(fMet)-specific endonuclease VapC